MPNIDPAAVAVNAAGIADALRACQLADSNGTVRLQWLTDHFESWVGVMMQVGEAAEMMEELRTEQGANATWGGELPYLYDVWDAIAKGLWADLGSQPVNVIVHRSIAVASGI